jgi:predicted nucleic acid-binding protein
MAKLQVFFDTGALLAILLFPKDKTGKATLAGEVLELYIQGHFDIVIGEVVLIELLEVIRRDFPEAHELVASFLVPWKSQLTRIPSQEEIKKAKPYTKDPEDAPVFASAVIARPDILVSNDFETFHTENAKKFWAEHNIQIESLYGLLCVFGRRKRKSEKI